MRKRKNIPCMILDITKKPGDANAVMTVDTVLSECAKLREENTKLREEYTKLREEYAKAMQKWKRDKAEAEANALAVGGLVEASRATAEKSSTVGDAAKLREAVEKVIKITEREWDAHRETSAMWDIHEICTSALAAPQRNCDKYSHDEALRIWSAEPENQMNGCFDDWLYLPATEQEGGAK